jgi:hypothetical protein
MATYQDYDYDERPATESEAHVEWHLNSGVPMGTPGCPQDACHIEDDRDHGPSAIAIVGSRDWDNQWLVRSFVKAVAAKYPHMTIVSGGARGVDQFAESAAAECGLRIISYRPIANSDHSYGIIRVAEDAAPTRVPDAHFTSFRAAAFARNALIVRDGEHPRHGPAREQARPRLHEGGLRSCPMSASLGPPSS